MIVMLKGNYYVKEINFLLYDFGRDKEFKIGPGTIHYPMKKYYIKLRTIKGEFDGIYTSQKDFNLIDFHCRKLFSQFDTISGNSKIIIK